MSKKNYIYTNAVCKTAEKKLIGADRLNRMCEADGLEEAYSILRETSFGPSEIEFAAKDYEKLITAEENALFSFIREYAPNKQCLAYFLYENDFANAEAIVRCEYNGIDENAYLCVDGAFTADEIRSAIDGQPTTLPAQLVGAIKQAKEVLESGVFSGIRLDTIFIRARYACLFAEVKNKCLRDILSYERDWKNISVCLRSRNKKLAYEMIIEGGSLSNAQLDVLCEGDENDIKKSFSSSDKKQLVLYAYDALSKGLPFVKCEQAVLNYAINKLKATMYETKGYEPFLLYCYYRKNQISNVRTVLSGKANGLDQSGIRCRLLNV